MLIALLIYFFSCQCQSLVDLTVSASSVLEHINRKRITVRITKNMARKVILERSYKEMLNLL